MKIIYVSSFRRKNKLDGGGFPPSFSYTCDFICSLIFPFYKLFSQQQFFRRNVYELYQLQSNFLLCHDIVFNYC